MATIETYRDGVLALRADDAARTVTTWPGGTSRPYTPEENAAADARAAAEQAQAQREADRTAVRAIITDLQAEKARAQAVIDGVNALPSPNATQQWVRDNARAIKRSADAAIDLARFVRDM